jgi:outer membrane lipoprotein carrier protein
MGWIRKNGTGLARAARKVLAGIARTEPLPKYAEPIMIPSRRRVSIALLTALLAVPATSGASAIDRLGEFVQATRSGRVAFDQVVTSKDGRKPERASGSFAFFRPGKFRFTYLKPYEQVIVGDGEKLWFYDKDLNQVTVRKLGNALGATPAAILAGSNDLAKNFVLAELPDRDGLEWLEAKPRARDTSFEIIRLGFSGANLAAMELHDTFGQTTTLRFREIERNPVLPADLFRFTPPPGADVVGE